MEQNLHNILLTNLWLEHIYLSKLTLMQILSYIVTGTTEYFNKIQKNSDSKYNFSHIGKTERCLYTRLKEHALMIAQKFMLTLIPARTSFTSNH